MRGRGEGPGEQRARRRSLDAERAALTQTELASGSLPGAEPPGGSDAEQRREVQQLAGALYDEQQALQARQRLLDEGRLGDRPQPDGDRAARGRDREAE